MLEHAAYDRGDTTQEGTRSNICSSPSLIFSVVPKTS